MKEYNRKDGAWCVILTALLCVMVLAGCEIEDSACSVEDVWDVWLGGWTEDTPGRLEEFGFFADQGLSAEREEQILIDFIFSDFFQSGRSEEERYRDIARFINWVNITSYCGTYNGNVAVFINLHGHISAFERTVTVAGVRFNFFGYSNRENVYIWSPGDAGNRGNFSTLLQAYESGLLTRDNVWEVAQRFSEPYSSQPPPVYWGFLRSGGKF